MCHSCFAPKTYSLRAQVWLPKGAETQTRRQCPQAMPRTLQLVAGEQLVTAVLDVSSPNPPRQGAPASLAAPRSMGS